MKQYLVFQLYAPMVSWGEEAVGEIRHTSAIPTRSALLGLLAAALGIRRDEEDRLNVFNQHYHLAVRSLSAQTRWLRDYHSVMMPRENKKYRYATRRDELCMAGPDKLETIITQREYHCDGYWHVAVSALPDAPETLERVQAALLSPHFPLYVGRKACPLSLPLAPRLMTGSLKEVFTQAGRELQPVELVALFDHHGRFDWDDPEESSLQQLEQQIRPHQPLSRRRWQFGNYTCFSGALGEGE